jgi:patatin-like phospholipase/acyl hydrolase
VRTLTDLDGGGVRGLSSLIILERLMWRADPNARVSDYFDMIGGTSTGGFVPLISSIRD